MCMNNTQREKERHQHDLQVQPSNSKRTTMCTNYNSVLKHTHIRDTDIDTQDLMNIYK